MFGGLALKKIEKGSLLVVLHPVIQFKPIIVLIIDES